MKGVSNLNMYLDSYIKSIIKLKYSKDITVKLPESPQPLITIGGSGTPKLNRRQKKKKLIIAKSIPYNNLKINRKTNKIFNYHNKFKSHKRRISRKHTRSLLTKKSK
jgi:hypothetical protein